MKKEIKNFHPLFLLALLIAAGLISPSNGVDDRTYKTPIEMLTCMVFCLSAAILVLMVWKLAENYGMQGTSSSNQNK